MLDRMDVIVVGAGVVGLTSAIRLAESGRRVTVWSAEQPRDTTSAVAGALCGPNFPYGDERLDRWGKAADTVFRELAQQPDTGVRLGRGRLASRAGDAPPWASRIPGFALCDPDESAGFPVAFWVEVPTADMPRYLDYLSSRLTAADGEIVLRRVADLAEAAEAAPVVVNCTGTGARDLVGDDRVRAVKGQHVIVANPGLDTFFYEAALEGNAWAGFFPYGDRVVLGGVQIDDDWDRTPDPAATQQILARCTAVEPRLAGAEILAVEAGLRPVRDTPRLEREPLGTAMCIHNYGHGGIGVTWSWGSADDVLALVP